MQEQFTIGQLQREKPLVNLARMDVYETRKRRFLELLGARYKGQVSNFCRVTLADASYISRIYSKNPNPKHRKTFTEKIAREYERLAGLPAGWLDQDETEKTPSESVQLTGIETQFLTMFRQLSADDKATAFGEVARMYYAGGHDEGAPVVPGALPIKRLEKIESNNSKRPPSARGRLNPGARKVVK